MQSRTVREGIRRHNERAEEKHRGLGEATMRLASHRVTESQIIHLIRLPCVVSNEQLQNADGSFLYLEGYSQPGGPDVGAPGSG